MRTRWTTGRVLVIGILAMVAIPACTSETPQNPPAATASATTAPPRPVSTAPTGVDALIDKLTAGRPSTAGEGAAPNVRGVKPFASSSKIESPKPASAAGKPEERVDAQSPDPARMLPALTAAVPRVWIGWYVDRSIDAFREAIDLNKPLVLVVAEPWCNYCVNLAADVLRCAAVDRFAGDAVFAYSFLGNDKGATAIAGSLKIAAYPTITILEPESRILLERGRINGYFESTIMGGHLETILWKSAPRILPDDFDAPASQRTTKPTPTPAWTPRPGGPATAVSAADGATNRRLVHALPAPKCK